MVRSHNEDSIASDAGKGLVVLADGMGGYNAGEVASGMATTVITTELQQMLEDHAPFKAKRCFGDGWIHYFPGWLGDKILEATIGTT
jgi:serine/threonine protein phosphatase PrpC